METSIERVGVFGVERSWVQFLRQFKFESFRVTVETSWLSIPEVEATLI